MEGAGMPEMVSTGKQAVALLDLSFSTIAVNRERILETLANVNWSRKLAAQKLGISESALRGMLSAGNDEFVN